MFIRRRQFVVYNLVRKNIKGDEEALRVLDYSWDVYSWNCRVLCCSFVVGILSCILFVMFANEHLYKNFVGILEVICTGINVILGIVLGALIAWLCSGLFIRSLRGRVWEVARDAVERCSHNVEDSEVSARLKGDCLELTILGKPVMVGMKDGTDIEEYSYDTDMVFELSKGGYISYRETISVYINGMLVLRYLPYEDRKVA